MRYADFPTIIILANKNTFIIETEFPSVHLYFFKFNY